jgi:hypothetical protein
LKNNPINKEIVNKLQKETKKTKVRAINLFVVVLVFGLLVCHALIINDCVGDDLRYQNLLTQKEELRASIRRNSKIIDNLKVPAQIQLKIQTEMMRDSVTGYLKDLDSQETVLTLKGS